MAEEMEDQPPKEPYLLINRHVPPPLRYILYRPSTLETFNVNLPLHNVHDKFLYSDGTWMLFARGANHILLVHLALSLVLHLDVFCTIGNEQRVYPWAISSGTFIGSPELGAFRVFLIEINPNGAPVIWISNVGVPAHNGEVDVEGDEGGFNPQPPDMFVSWRRGFTHPPQNATRAYSPIYCNRKLYWLHLEGSVCCYDLQNDTEVYINLPPGMAFDVDNGTWGPRNFLASTNSRVFCVLIDEDEEVFIFEIVGGVLEHTSSHEFTELDCSLFINRNQGGCFIGNRDLEHPALHDVLWLGPEPEDCSLYDLVQQEWEVRRACDDEICEGIWLVTEDHFFLDNIQGPFLHFYVPNEVDFPHQQQLLEEDEEAQDGEEEPEVLDQASSKRTLTKRIGYLVEASGTEYVDEIKHKLKELHAEDATDFEQQAPLLSVKDTKIWMIRCVFGSEHEVAVSFMQKYIARPDLQIRSVIGLNYLKKIYVEAEEADDVKEACKGLPYIFHQYPIEPVSLKNMTNTLEVESKVSDLTYDAWVRINSGIYKGDIAKVVDVIGRKVTIKLIPRVDLQRIANKHKNAEMPQMKAFRPPPRFFNKSEARSLNLRILRMGGCSGGMFDCVDGLMFKDGFLYKTVSMKSISVGDIQPTFDELKNFSKPSKVACRDLASSSIQLANTKKGHFRKDVVKRKIVPLQAVKETCACDEVRLCKFIMLGSHVKVVSGDQVGMSGIVVFAEGYFLIVKSDTTNELIRVSTDDVVESAVITTDITRIRHFDLDEVLPECNGGDELGSRFEVASSIFLSPGGLPSKAPLSQFEGGGRGHGNELVGRSVRTTSGPFKGECSVTEVKGMPVCCVSDVLVYVLRPVGNSSLGVIREVLQDGSYRVAMGRFGYGDVYTVAQTDVEMIRPKKFEKTRVISGALCGSTGKLLGQWGSAGIMKFDGSLGVQRVDMNLLAVMVPVAMRSQQGPGLSQ